MSKVRSKLVDVGRLGSVYGVKGWLRVQSFTEAAQSLFEYHPWWLKTRHGVKQVEVDASRTHGNGFVVHIRGLDDRDQAAQYTGAVIAVEPQQFADLPPEDYYWHQLEGLRVISHYEGARYELGRVARLIETGANDVLVVTPDETSMDDRERLVPYIPGQFVRSVQLAEGIIEVDWDPEF